MSQFRYSVFVMTVALSSTLLADDEIEFLSGGKRPGKVLEIRQKKREVVLNRNWPAARFSACIPTAKFTRLRTRENGMS